jgi:hypothetical protein
VDEGNDNYGYPLQSGLYNSAKLCMEMVRDRLGYNAYLDQLIDANSIDKNVHDNNPDVVILEAYWVTPTKLRELSGLHPNVIWVVRNHSSLPFLSLESVVMDWSLQYVDIPNVVLSNNDIRTNQQMAQLIFEMHRNFDQGAVNANCVLLPNFYPPILLNDFDPTFDGDTVNVGCFGAIRPLKNHLNQAVAAILFAQDLGINLNFHINSTRIEQNSSAILKNMRAVFNKMPSQFKLVEHAWMERPEFLALVEQMDIGMQVSFSETFNIVTADFVVNSKPVVVSPEITWVHPKYYANTVSTQNIKNKLEMTLNSRNHVNFYRLRLYSYWSAGLWQAFFHSPVVRGGLEWNPASSRDDLYVVSSLPSYHDIADPEN